MHLVAVAGFQVIIGVVLPDKLLPVTFHVVCPFIGSINLVSTVEELIGKE